ncbi:putative membrane protein [Kribbella aluminosa]|uniref:Membrane protein n=1 Tax=Kribbella aluminosa TaxID=416017 RepID=A0ABS4UV76_9ACTN|nr:hypothetical protein [Kribbella aluminosa]MBP2355536.1 putative membrane protein [Kribbella aluminosa]
MITDVERRQILHNALMLEASQGNRVTWVGVYQAHVWRMPAATNHLLHGVLSLLTFGLRLLVWALVALTEAKPQLVGIAVNEYGQIYVFNALEARRLAQQ